MIGLSRRQFATSLAAAGLGLDTLLRQAMAQAAASPATRNLPRTYSGRTLRIVWGNSPAFISTAEFSKEFTAATGVQLEFSQLPTAERYQKMILDTSTNTNSFDIYIVAYQWKEQVAPFVIDHTGLDKEVAGVPAMNWDDYPQQPLAAYSKLGNKMVTIPIVGDVSFTIWNKAAYRAAGLDPEQGPATWRQLFENGQKLRSGEQYGYNLPAGKTIQTACVWITLFHSFGGQYFDPAGKPLLDSPASIAAFRFMVENLGKISPPGNLTWDFPEMLASLSTAQAAQGYMWAGGVTALYDPSKSKIAQSLGYAPTPEMTLLGGWGVAANAKSRNLDAAKLFLGWLTSPEIVKQIGLLSMPPTRRSALFGSRIDRALSFPAVGVEGHGGEGRGLCADQGFRAGQHPDLRRGQCGLLGHEDAGTGRGGPAGARHDPAQAARLHPMIIR